MEARRAYFHVRTGCLSWGDLRNSEPPPETLLYLLLRLIKSIFWHPSSKGNDLDLIVPFPGYKVDSLTRWVADEFYIFNAVFRTVF
jgi:hypothetical protein